MTGVPDDTSLSSALAAWQPMLSHQEDTWFFCENGETVQTVLSSLHTPVLKDHVTTLRAFAKRLVTERCPDLRILTIEEQTAIIHHIIRQLPWGKKTRSLPIALVSDLIGRYNFFREHHIDLTVYLDDRTKPKHQLLATIFHEYETYCGDTILDDIGVMKKAIELLNEDNPVESGIVFHIQPADLLTQTLLDAVAANRNVREFRTPVYRITAPPTLQYPIIKYRTAREEVEATLEKVAELLESGTDPHDILIISPDIEASARLIGTCLDDFYYRNDGRYLPVRCSGLDTPLASLPIIQCVTAVVSAVQNRRFVLDDLQLVAASRYFPKQDMVSVDDLTRFAVTASVSENEYDWMQAVSRMESDTVYGPVGAKVARLLSWLKQSEDVSAHPTYGTRTAALRKWLYLSGWLTCPDLTDTESHARDLLLTYFASFTDTATGAIPCDASTYAMTLRDYLQNMSVPLPVGRRDAVRLCRLRDASDQVAEHVFIIALTAAKIPSVMSTLSPFSMKETADICRRPDGTSFSLSDIQCGQELQNFGAALQTASRTLTLSCHMSDGSSNTAPSSFLTRLGDPEEPGFVPMRHSVWYDQIEAGTAIRTRSPIDRPLLALQDAEPVAEIVGRETCGYASDFSGSGIRDIFEDIYTDHVFSATEIEMYLACPYRWYLSRHVGLQNPQDRYAETTNYGTLVHAGLEKFIATYGRRLGSMSPEVAEQTVLATIRGTFDAYRFIASPTWASKIRWCLGDAYDGQVSVFRRFAADEVAYARDGWFSNPTVRNPDTGQVVTPGDLECTIADVTVTYGEETMRVKGFIDRVMQRSDGTFRIVDYKTGDGFTRELDRLVQIPLYAEAFSVMHPEMKSAGGYYLCLKNTEKYGAVKPNLKSDEGEESWKETRDRVLAMAFAAKRDMQKGIASRNPACVPDYCPYKDICRRGNLAADEEEEDDP